jgi:hypothetical protein
VTTALLLVMAPDVAVTDVEPTVIAVARPVAFTVATAGTEELQVEEDVMSTVDASV